MIKGWMRQSWSLIVRRIEYFADGVNDVLRVKNVRLRLVGEK